MAGDPESPGRTLEEARGLKEDVAAAQGVIDELNARLRQKTSQLQIIQTIASDINSTLDLDRIFQIILDSMDAMFGFRHSMIAFADDATQHLEVVASRGYDGAGIGARVPYGRGVLGMVAKKRKILRIVNIGAAMRYVKAATGANAGDGAATALPGLQNVQSQIAIPLVVKDRLIGVYAVESATQNAFDTLDELILNIVAQQLAASIDNARAYRTQARLAEVYQRYVPAEFLACLGRSSILEIQRGDHVEREMSILFSDMRSYTSIVEGNSHEENFAFINHYYARLERAIRQAGGFVDSYEGDAVMALFAGAGTDSVADQAVRAGIAMFRALEDYNQERAAEGKTSISMGLGVNTGRLILGTIGSTERMKCGVIGDPVNLAARIEGMTKVYGAAMLISDSTRARLSNPDAYSLRLIDRVRAVGKSAPVMLFEVLDTLPEPARAARLAAIDRFNDARVHFTAGHMDQAVRAFEILAAEQPLGVVAAAQMYLDRCRELAARGVPDDWDGVLTLRSK